MLKPLLIAIVMSLTISVFCDEYNAANYVPEKTMLYLEMDNGQKFCEQMREIGLWQLFESQEWQAFFNTIPPEIIDLLKDQQQNVAAMTGMSLQEVALAFSGHISLAVADVIPGQMPLPVALLSWDLGTQKEKILALVNNLHLQMNGAEMRSYEYKGYQIFEAVTPAMPVYSTTMGNVWMVCSSKSHLEDMLVNKESTKLASNENYKAVKANVLRERSGILLYADIDRLVNLGLQMSGKEKDVRPVLDMTGLDSIKALGAGVHFAKGQVVESVYIHIPGERKGFLGKIMPQKAASNHLEKFVPDNLIGFQHSHVDLQGLLSAGLEALQMFMPREHKQFTQMEQGMNQQLGVDIRKDIVYNIGTEFLYTWSFSGGLIPDIAIQMTLKDMETFQNSLDKVMQMVPKQFRYKFLWNGYHFNYFNFSSMSDPIPVAPTFVIADNRIIFTLYPEMAKNLIVQKDGHFPEDMKKYIDGRGYIDLQYLNLEDVVVPLYRTMLPFVQSMIPRSEVPIEFGLLPAANTLKEYLHNAMQIWILNEEGLTFEFHSPFGIAPLMATFALAFQGMEKEYPSQDITEAAPVEDPAYDDSEDTTESSDLEFDLTSIQDSRSRKLESSKYASKVYFSKSVLKLNFWSTFPENILSYGNFDINASDDLGNSLVYKPGFGLGDGKHKKVDSYVLKNVIRDKGMTLSVDFEAPVREAQSITVLGSFEVKTAEFKKLELPNYSKLLEDKHEVTNIDGLTLQFMDDSKEKTIKLSITGDAVRLKSVHTKVGEIITNSGSWSSYKSKGKTISSYWFRNAIPKDATIVIEYADSVKTEKIDINLQEVKLP